MDASARSRRWKQHGRSIASRWRRGCFPIFWSRRPLILVFVFTLWPTVQSVSGSLYRPPLTVRQQSQFVGLQNYVDLFDSEQSTRPDIAASFPKILVNTLVFTAATVVISVPLALLFALLLNRKLRFLAAVALQPVLPGAAAADRRGEHLGVPVRR